MRCGSFRIRGSPSAAKVIEFRHSTDAELKDDGYRYFFEGDRFVIEGAVKRGCMYGVYRFLQNELDWAGIGSYGQTVLSNPITSTFPPIQKKSETPAFSILTLRIRVSLPLQRVFRPTKELPRLRRIPTVR